MRRLALTFVASLVALALIGAVLGDPRAAEALGRAVTVDVAGFVVAVAVALYAWTSSRRRSLWLLPVVVFFAVFGGLCGWIAGAELTLHPDVALHASTAPGRVAFMLAMTALGIALPSSLLAGGGAARR